MVRDNEHDNTKLYEIKRTSKEKIIQYNTEIKIFILFHDKNRKYVENIEKELQSKRMELVKGFTDTVLAFDINIDILSNFDYMVVIVSKPLLEDLELLNALTLNYDKNEDNNKKIIPIIVWKDLYQPESKGNIIRDWKNRIRDFRENYLQEDYDGAIADDLKKMQHVEEMLQKFLQLVTNRDRQRNLSGAQKILKYIEYESGKKVVDRIESKGEKGGQTIYLEKGAQLNVAMGEGIVNTTQNNN